MPIYANGTAQPYPSDPGAIQEQLSQHLLQPVLFTQQIENMYTAGATIFVEFGPRNILTNLVKNILADRAHLAIALNIGNKKDSDRQLHKSVAQLRVAGLQLRDEPYAVVSKPAEVKSKRSLNIQLNGSNYVSDRTRARYDAALRQPAPSPVDEAPALKNTPVVSAPEPAAQGSSVLHAEILAQLIDQQNETSRLHEEYLRQQAERTQALLKLLGEETGALLWFDTCPAQQQAVSSWRPANPLPAPLPAAAERTDGLISST